VNVRHGDIEAQVTLERLGSDLFPYLKACVEGSLKELEKPKWKPEWSFGIALVSGRVEEESYGKELASKAGMVEEIVEKGYDSKEDWNLGYPFAHLTNQPINGLNKVKGVSIYHNGTEILNRKLFSSGGRVLTLVTTDKIFSRAKEKIYRAAKEIDFPTKRYRKEPIPKDKLGLLQKLEREPLPIG
jgi:phosphoribosylamine-glycine ligase